jgi:hypothetical protein
MAKGAIFGAFLGGAIGGVTSALSGGSFFEGFEEGAFTGAITGAFFGGLGGAGQILGKAFGASCRIFDAVRYTAIVSGSISFGMGAFDLLSFGIGLFDPTNLIVQANQKLHSNNLYNAFQIGISALAVFSGSAYFTMKPMPKVCFVAGTMVLTATGLVAIENIKVGDKVLSTNAETMESGTKPVLQTFINESKELAHVFVDNEEIISTPTHLFYTVGDGWIFAAKLSCENTLMLPGEDQAKVERITLENLEEPIEVYNFEVADWHTYHVGSMGVLVHNDCDVDPRKFSDYAFREKHGKDKVFRSLGYSESDAAELTKIYTEQGTAKFNAGEYTLGKADQWG